MIPAFMRESEEYLHVPEPKDALGRTARRDWAGDQIMERLMIYEQRIESSMYKAMGKFKQLQAVRKKEKEAEQELPGETLALTNPKACLKKQSQFTQSTDSVKAYNSKTSRNKARPNAAENKANQSQFSKPTAGEAAGKGEESSGGLAR